MSLLFKISYGLYVLSSSANGKQNGCMINTVMQQTNTPERVSITVNKGNLTHDYIVESGKASVSILNQLVTFDMIKHFGFQSGRVANKFDGIPAKVLGSGNLVPTSGVVGYLDLEVVDKIDMGTHTQFVCSIAEEVQGEGGEPLTYAYYHSHVKVANKPVVAEGEVWECNICGYVHKGALPKDIVCPLCKHGASDFTKQLVGKAEEKKIIKTGESKMKKFVCSVCGYVHEGDAAPAFCPTCKVPSEKFTEQSGDMSWAAEHVVGVAKGVSEDIIADLRANFEGECTEVGMYLAMARVAHREGYPEVGMYYEKAAFEEAEHAAKFAELLGEVITDSTAKNLQLRVDAENGATAGKFDLAKRAKAANLDAINDTVHEMARDEARHGKAFLGLLNRYFK